MTMKVLAGNDLPQNHTALKAEMLCLGVVPSRDLEPVVRQALDGTFIHGVVFQMETGQIVNTSVWQWPEAADPIPRGDLCPPRLEQDELGLFVEGQAGRSRVRLLHFNEVAELSLDGRPLGEWFTLHNPQTVFCAPTRQCIFITMGQPCRFCTFEGGRISPLPIPAFKSGLEAVCRSYSGITSLAIGGGTPDLHDMGATYFSALVKEAVAIGLATSVELVPPKTEDQVVSLVRAGVSSLIMSLEVWGDESRKNWCLGKGLIERSNYERAWNWGIKHLGQGRVASVLLVGSESLEDTLKGASELIRQGVIPTLIPLRWYTSSRFDNWTPVAPRDYWNLERDVARLLRSAHLSPAQQPGCTACGGCSLEVSLRDRSGEDGCLGLA